VDYVPISMPKHLRKDYDSIQSNRKEWCDNKSLFMRLRQFIAQKFEDTIIEEIAQHAKSLVKTFKRRPLIFANTKKEKDSIIACLGKLTQCRVYTVHEAAYGLNMQHECDCIVTRPQSGDLMEQMKGRIDRPGQKKKRLILKILFVENTVEEAEASNIRICGQFVRQYLDPLSETFATMVLEHGIQSIQNAFQHMLDNETIEPKSNKKNASKRKTKTQKEKPKPGQKLKLIIKKNSKTKKSSKSKTKKTKKTTK